MRMIESGKMHNVDKESSVLFPAGGFIFEFKGRLHLFNAR